MSRRRMDDASFDPDAVDADGLPLVYNEVRLAGLPVYLAGWLLCPFRLPCCYHPGSRKFEISRQWAVDRQQPMSSSPCSSQKASRQALLPARKPVLPALTLAIAMPSHRRRRLQSTGKESLGSWPPAGPNLQASAVSVLLCKCCANTELLSRCLAAVQTTGCCPGQAVQWHAGVGRAAVVKSCLRETHVVRLSYPVHGSHLQLVLIVTLSVCCCLRFPPQCPG